MAKFRAARRLWARIMRDRFGATNPKAQALRFHAQTGGSTLTAQQPENNVVRVAIQALSAVLGGAQSLHTNGFDEALALPTEHSATIALRTQQILMHEAGTTDTADPLGGAYYVESLTDELERQRASSSRASTSWAAPSRRSRRLRAGRDRGGRVPLADDDRDGKRTRDRRRQHVRQTPMRQGRDPRSTPPPSATAPAHRPGAGRPERRGRRERPRRPEARPPQGEDNLLPPHSAALRARCTIGEICTTLRGLWGTFDRR